MKVEKTYKLPKGTLILTDTPLPSDAYQKKIKINGNEMVIHGVALEDDSSFMVKETLSNINGKEIEFVN